jgi:hypothetical protein
MASRVYNVSNIYNFPGISKRRRLVRDRLGNHRHYLYSVHFMEMAITRLDSRKSQA